MERPCSPISENSNWEENLFGGPPDPSLRRSSLEKGEAKGLEGEESNRIKYNKRYQEREESNPQRQVWSLPFFL